MEELSIVQEVWRTALGMGIAQWLAFVFSIVYVILAAKENIWCWPFGLISVILAFVVYIDPEVRLYSDATLQVYYMGMSIYGWIAWRKRDTPQTTATALPIHTWGSTQHLLTFAVGSALALLLGYFWTWMNAALPYIDAFTTSFSIIATYMVARKILENWLYWIVIDTVCIFVYLHRGLYLFALLFLIYCIIAVYGYINWRKQMNPIVVDS